MNRTQAIEYAKILKTLIELNEVSIILNTFYNAFCYKTALRSDGMWYLHGNFNLGGTVSGRLSSSNINLQNLPSTGSKYAKTVKSCFVAPPGWIMVGADFSSLEDRISALTTKDPNKLKVYTDGYDGHCLRSYSYFSKQMPDIIDTVKSINSIENKYPKLRQKSKGPTFLLTYGGTYIGLIGLGFTEEEALEIEKNYHRLYKVSDEWVFSHIENATKCGYVTVAFGLRLRTPVLSKTILNTKVTPHKAKSEARTAGNALGQSYGMLNNRAAIEFQERLLASSECYNVKPISHIHDAQYFLVRENVDTIKWVNDNLIECMEWQKLPEIQHPTVKLGGELSMFIPDWSREIKIPNKADKATIEQLLKKAKIKSWK